MSDKDQILLIVAATVVANVAFAAWLMHRHGFIRQVRTLVVLTVVLVGYATVWAIRTGDSSASDGHAASGTDWAG
jgi:ABC-type enterochelin transport system permease subunit